MEKKWTDFPIILYTSCHQWWKDDSEEENIKHSTREYLFIDEIYILILIIHYQKINSRIQFRQKFKEFFLEQKINAKKSISLTYRVPAIFVSACIVPRNTL